MSPSAEATNGTNLTEAAVAKNLAKANASLASDNVAKVTAPNGTNGVSHAPAGLDASLLTYKLTPNLPPLDFANIPKTANICTDHMITCRWTSSTGWQAPALVPYGPLSIMPNASVLHYATECFEGLKLYRGFDNKLRLFRPSRNCKRMLVSAARIALPSFDVEQLLTLIKKLCAVDGARWLPRDVAKGGFLYLRPTLIADFPSLGVQRPQSALLYILLSQFPSMAKPGGLRLMASSEDTIRAHEGGWGFAKVGANYGPTLAASDEARERGYDQVLWLLPNRTGGKTVMEVTEAGASNFFVVLRAKEGGGVKLVTAPIEQKVILDGVTRRSILDLAAERLSSKGEASRFGLEAVDIQERKIDMQEIVEAVAEGRIVEAFAAGTAYFVSAVSVVHFQGQDLQMPMSKGDTGAYAEQFKTWLADIMYGNEEHEWGVVVDEE